MKHSVFILLVEDDQSMLNGMYDLFQMPSLLESVGLDYDIEVATASNGQDALDIMARRTPDLIVSDIMMPVMDGYVFLSKVQENPAWLHIPFIFLTARGNKEEILDGHLRGANLYITKPFASIELLELIRSQLERSFRRQLTNEQNISELKKDILQILNHEFRTPLTYVTAYYEMLSESVTRSPDDHHFRDYLRGIQAGCVRLTRLIEDFIMVIELRTGEYKTKYQRRARLVTTINSLVETAVQKQQAAANEKGVAILLSLDPEMLPVYGDLIGLQMIFDRLLNNAIKFIPKNKPAAVYIQTECRDNCVRISFRDEGIGMPVDIRGQIFDLFFQYDRQFMEQQGAGTGLTIAQGIVGMHNGRIDVESQENVGSTFTVVLPIFSGSKQSLAPEYTQIQPKATILAVEDEVNLLMGLKELLEIASEKYDLTVLTAVNGQEGLEILNQRKPDLIISDIMMPVMDGFAFLENIRQNPAWIHIPFIFLTAKGEHGDIHRGLSEGAEIYLTKPYESHTILQLVTSQLDQYFQLQSIQSKNFDSLKRSILQLITPDFRLPLTAVQEYSNILAANLDNVHNDEELKRSLQGMYEGSIRLEKLVDDFISLAELRTGESETAYSLREQPIFHPGHLFCNIVQNHKYINSREDISIQCKSQDNLPPLYGDAETLSGGISRLLEAVAYSCSRDEHQQLEVSVTQKGAEVCCQLVLPSAILEQEFSDMLLSGDMNFLDSTSYAPSLIIAKNYIALNNGRIQINSPNQISIYFPVHTEPILQ